MIRGRGLAVGMVKVDALCVWWRSPSVADGQVGFTTLHVNASTGRAVHT